MFGTKLVNYIKEDILYTLWLDERSYSTSIYVTDIDWFIGITLAKISTFLFFFLLSLLFHQLVYSASHFFFLFVLYLIAVIRSPSSTFALLNLYTYRWTILSTIYFVNCGRKHLISSRLPGFSTFHYIPIMRECEYSTGIASIILTRYFVSELWNFHLSCYQNWKPF